MMVKSDFISKIAIKHKASKSKTSLAKEKESFYNNFLLRVSVVVIIFSRKNNKFVTSVYGKPTFSGDFTILKVSYQIYTNVG